MSGRPQRPYLESARSQSCSGEGQRERRASSTRGASAMASSCRLPDRTAMPKSPVADPTLGRNGCSGKTPDHHSRSRHEYGSAISSRDATRKGTRAQQRSRGRSVLTLNNARCPHDSLGRKKHRITTASTSHFSKRLEPAVDRLVKVSSLFRQTEPPLSCRPGRIH